MNIWNPGYTQFTYFWGEEPFTQWCPSKFTVGEVTYVTAEQFMMASKARLFGDTETEKQILETRDPRQQKKLGKLVTPFDKEKWDSMARAFVYTGNRAKFLQDDKALEALKATDGTLLVEASPYDKIWGIGLSAFDAKSGKAWQGTNWLGEVLTKLREDLLGTEEKKHWQEYAEKIVATWRK